MKSPAKHDKPDNANGEQASLRAALYLRVSTGRQAESDLSIPDQRRQATNFCAARGWQVVIEFVDAGLSGTDDKRPELQRLLDMATSSIRLSQNASAKRFSPRTACEQSWAGYWNAKLPVPRIIPTA